MKEQILLENKSNDQLHCLFLWCMCFYIDVIIALPSMHSDFESFIYDVVHWPSDSNNFINCVKLQPKFVHITDMWLHWSKLNTEHRMRI